MDAAHGALRWMKGKMMDQSNFDRFADLADKELRGTLTDAERVELDGLYAASESNAAVRDAWERDCQRHWDASA
jgi:hypothetical protein